MSIPSFLKFAWSVTVLTNPLFHLNASYFSTAQSSFALPGVPWT